MDIIIFETIFIILSSIFVLITLIWCGKFLFNRDVKRASKILLRALVSAFLGISLMFSIFVVSAILSLAGMPIEYGLYPGLIIVPMFALYMFLSQFRKK